MTSITETTTYCPPDLWTPDAVNLRLAQATDPILSSSEVGEHLIARCLSLEVGRHITSYDPGIYRAAKATEYKKGNCLAEAEVVMGTGQLLGLSMYMLWDRKHASVILAGRKAIWEIDYESSGKWGKLPYETITGAGVTAHQKAGREIIRHAQGRAFINRNYTPGTPVEWQAIEGELGEAVSVFDSSALLLPAIEAVKFASALGDTQRYANDDPLRLEQIKTQIDTYLPNM